MSVFLFGHPSGLRIDDDDLKGHASVRQPGDLTILRPRRKELPDGYEPLEDTPLPPDAPDPVFDAPLDEPGGGTVYFARRDTGDLYALLRLLEINVNSTEYAAFAYRGDPIAERFLEQIKLVSFPALSVVYKVTGDAMPPPQTLTLGKAMLGFISAQTDYWVASDRMWSPKLKGTAGGDGDQDREALAFGLHVEHPKWGIYRVWSRARRIGK